VFGGCGGAARPRDLPGIGQAQKENARRWEQEELDRFPFPSSSGLRISWATFVWIDFKTKIERKEGEGNHLLDHLILRTSKKTRKQKAKKERKNTRLPAPDKLDLKRKKNKKERKGRRQKVFFLFF
jgi:hypothetical protein